VSLEGAIYSILTTSSSLMAATTAIYPGVRKEDDAAALPAVVYSRVGGDRVYTLGGYAGVETANYSFDVYATSVDSRRAVADALVLALSSADSSTMSVVVDAPTDAYDDLTGEYQRSFGVSITVREE